MTTIIIAREGNVELLVAFVSENAVMNFANATRTDFLDGGGFE
jgi:hypothetical protein